jgi:hypothetical protein
MRPNICRPDGSRLPSAPPTPPGGYQTVLSANRQFRTAMLGGQFGHFRALTAGIARPVLPPGRWSVATPASRCTPGQLSASFRHPCSAVRHFLDAGRRRQHSRAIVRQHLQVRITDSIVAARPTRGRASIRTGCGPRAGSTFGLGLAPQSRGAVPGRTSSADGPPRGRSSRPHRAPRRGGRPCEP